jgi:hypothetical protein
MLNPWYRSIIAVHGLNPKLKDNDFHARETWSKPKGGKGQLWLQDRLAATLPNARIFYAVYDSGPVFGNKDRFFHQASTLLEEITIKREDISVRGSLVHTVIRTDQFQDPKRPIIFIAHSLGGILVKQVSPILCRHVLLTNMSAGTGHRSK